MLVDLENFSKMCSFIVVHHYDYESRHIMLKLQDVYATLIATLEDFILLVYTVIDDLYQQFVPASVYRFNRTRKVLLQVTEQLSEQLNAEKVLAKSFRGLCTRLQNKVLGHNLCMAFNSIFLSFCDIGKIKQLIF